MNITDTKVIKIGNKVIGGGNPILIQSMTNVATENVAACVEQIHRLEAAGCDIIRCTVPTMEAALALKEIKKQIHIPLVADIHFDYRMAIAAMENGADKIRINPGNIGSMDRVKAVVDVTGLPASSVKTCMLKLYDGDGDPIDTTYLNYVGKSDGINVTVSMLNTKTIPLVFSYSGTPAENYKVADVEWKPELIEVAGNSEVLAALTNLRIPAEAVNVDGIEQELQLIIDITEYLPSGVVLKDEASASVLVIVELEYFAPESETQDAENQQEDTTVKPEDSPLEEMVKPEDTEESEASTPEESQNPEENTNDQVSGEQSGTDQRTEDSNAKESDTALDGTEGQNI